MIGISDKVRIIYQYPRWPPTHSIEAGLTALGEVPDTEQNLMYFMYYTLAASVFQCVQHCVSVPCSRA